MMMDTVSQWAMVFQDMGGAPLKESSEDQKLLSQAMVIVNMPLSPDNQVPQSSDQLHVPPVCQTCPNNTEKEAWTGKGCSTDPVLLCLQQDPSTLSMLSPTQLLTT